MRIKGIDDQGKTHWLSLRPNDNYIWGTEIHASDMPRMMAQRWFDEVTKRNRYLEPNDRMIIKLDRSIL